MQPETSFKEPRRKRIIIDVGQRSRKPTGKRRRRWPRVLALLTGLFFVFLLLCAGIAFFWWQRYKTTPPYSLALLVNAAQQNDAKTIDELVDTNQIVDNLAAELTEKVAGRYGSTLTSAGRSRLDQLVPSLLPGIKQVARDAIVQRIQELSQKAGEKPFILLALGMPYVVNITTENDSARVTWSWQNRPVELQMQRNGERWKVSSVKDDQLTPALVDSLIKDLPAIGQLGASEIGKQLGLTPRTRRRRR